MHKVHFFLQGKGGVGKSLSAALLAQHQMENGATPVCIDTDPVNQTFSGYKALNVQFFNIMKDDEVDSRAFDELVQQISQTKSNMIIDNGASSFIALTHYLQSSEILPLLNDLGFEVYIHCVVTGGQAVIDTLNGLNYLLEGMGDQAKFVVWLNPFWGDIEVDGKSFYDMAVYKKYKSKIHATIELPKLKQALAGRDFVDVLNSKQTLSEAIASETTKIVPKQRLTIIRREIFGLLDQAIIA